ncbi:hypothetical protein FQZ97_754420 [compost metagenome]
MVANARHQLDRVGQLDQVIVGAGGEGQALHRRLFLGRQDDDRDIAGRRMGAVLADQRQTIGAGHHQVLEDHRGADLDRQGNRVLRVGTVVEIDIRIVRQRSPDCFADHRLVVDQQHQHIGIA